MVVQLEARSHNPIECFSGIYCEISPDMANVVKMHICCSANDTDVTSHAEGGIEYNTKVANIR